MWSGSETLANINTAVSRIHAEESGLDRATQQALTELERVQQARANALRDLARLKLDELAAGRLTQNLDAAERRALELLEARKQRMAKASAAREAAFHAVGIAESKQAEAAQTVEKAVAKLDSLRARIEASLADDARILALRAEAKAAQAVADEATRKAEQNAKDLAAKKKPYDDDPLFQYLWSRGFGTASYAGRGLTRFLDRRVADFIGFLDVRANYHMLSEIPQRLTEHAATRQAEVEKAKAALAAQESEALARAGAPSLEAELAAARRVLAEADADLEERRKTLKQADEQRQQTLDGSGDPDRDEAVAGMAANDMHDSIERLFAEARRTSTGADDAVVQQIAQIDARRHTVERTLSELRKSSHQLARRRMELERTRDRFRHSGYDHPQATFGNERVIAEVLGGILSGAVKGSILWDTLRGGYGNRPPASRPDFGGGFPFPMPGGWGDPGSIGGEWRNPGSTGPWMPDTGGSSSGPFGGGSAIGDAFDSASEEFTTGGRF